MITLERLEEIEKEFESLSVVRTYEEEMEILALAKWAWIGRMELNWCMNYFKEMRADCAPRSTDAKEYAACIKALEKSLSTFPRSAENVGEG